MGAVVIGLTAICFPIWVTVLFWSNLKDPSVLLILGAIWLLSLMIFFIPGLIRSANKRIIIDEEGLILEDLSEKKLKWKEIEKFKIEYHLAKPYLAIFTKPDSAYAQDYWDTHIDKFLNKWFSEKDSINLYLMHYKQKPEEILADLMDLLNTLGNNVGAQ